MNVFINLRDHYCKFLNSHYQHWTLLKRLPMSQSGSHICYNTLRTPHQVYTTSKHQLLTKEDQLDVSAVKTSPALYLTKMMGRGELDKSTLHAAGYDTVFFNPVNPYAVPVSGLPAWVQKKHL